MSTGKSACAVVCLAVALLGSSTVLAQTSLAPQSAQSTAAVSVPRLVKFSGVVKDTGGNPRSGVTGMTFALYKDQAGGAALWLETQNVTLDAQGRYTVLLGANSAEGMPVELFTANEARWLGVQPEGLLEHRVLLVSVPYALKAGDAETLGGRPASSFVLAAAPTASDSNSTAQTGTNTTAAGTSGPSPATIGGGGTPNKVTKFDGTGGNVIDTSISDNGTVVSTMEPVGIGTSSPGAQLDIQLNTPTGQNAVNSIVTLSNTSALPGIVSPLNLNLHDSSQANVLSKQSLRLAYIRDAGATGGVTAFDTGLTSSAFIHENASYALRGANFEGPNVDPGKTLTTFYGAFFDQPNATGTTGTVTNYYGAYFRTLTGATGTLTNKFALVTEPGAGNVGFGTVNPGSQLEVAGNMTVSGGGVITGNGSGLTNVNAASLTSGTIPSSALNGVNGSGLTNLNVTTATGTLPAADLPAGIALLNAGPNTFTWPLYVNASPAGNSGALNANASGAGGGAIGLVATTNDAAGAGAVIQNTAVPTTGNRAYILEAIDYTGNHGLAINANGLEINVPIAVRIPNDATGTTLNTLVRFTNTGTVATIPTSGGFSQISAIGIVVADAGTSGKATVAFTGIANCLFDNFLPTTVGDYVVPSVTVVSGAPVTGYCHDYGPNVASGLPNNPLPGVQIVGRVTKSNNGVPPCTSGGGCQGVAAQVYLYSYETRAIGQVASLTFTGQTAAIPATTLFTPLVPGLFRINVYIVPTVGTTCSGSCIGADVSFHDETQAQSLAFAFISGLAGAFTQQSVVIHSIGGQPITFSTTYAGTNLTYEAFVTLERLM